MNDDEMNAVLRQSTAYDEKGSVKQLRKRSVVKRLLCAIGSHAPGEWFWLVNPLTQHNMIDRQCDRCGYRC